MPFLTVCTVVMHEGKILLTKREDFRIWCLPSGGVDDGETVVLQKSMDIECRTLRREELYALRDQSNLPPDEFYMQWFKPDQIHEDCQVNDKPNGNAHRTTNPHTKLEYVLDHVVYDELTLLLAERSAALVRKDAVFFKQLLTEDFTYVNASGILFDKPGYLTFYLYSDTMLWQTQELHEVQIRLYGETAVVTCRIHDRATHLGQPFEADFRSTQVFVRQENAWRYAAGQTTSIGE